MTTDKSSKNPQKKPAGERKRRGEGRSGGRRRPFFNRGFVKNTLRLNETHCLLLMDGAKRAVFPALYYMEGVMPFVTNEKKEIRAVNRMLDDLIEEGARKLTEIQASLDALCKDNAVETALSYDNPASAVSVYVHSPRIARYATLLEPFDRIVATVTSLWLAGVLDEVERSEIVMDGRNTVRRTGNRIINLKLRAWAALNRSAAKSLKGILVETESVPEDKFIEDPNPTALPDVEARGDKSERAETAAAATIDTGVESVGSAGSDAKQKERKSKPKAEALDAAPASEELTKKAVAKKATGAKGKASTKAVATLKPDDADVDVPALSAKDATAAA